jgi:hypothetical protein
VDDDISGGRYFVEKASVNGEHAADAFESADPELFLRIRFDGDLGDVPRGGAKELAAWSIFIAVGGVRVHLRHWARLPCDAALQKDAALPRLRSKW